MPWLEVSTLLAILLIVVALWHDRRKKRRRSMRTLCPCCKGLGCWACDHSGYEE
jgi:hypothetical protein